MNARFCFPKWRFCENPSKKIGAFWASAIPKRKIGGLLNMAGKDMFKEMAEKRKTLLLYHGSLEKRISPAYGLGEERNPFGKGFYLTEDIDLAKEWAICRPEGKDGYVHKYELNIDGLKILDLAEKGVLAWLSELMKHRDASDSRRYRLLAERFIRLYGVESESYDLIKGYRADASYFYIAREFVRDNVDIDILEELLSLGELGIQYCLKSKKAFDSVHEIDSGLVLVPYSEFNPKYNERDARARERMHGLIDSERNKVSKVFSTLLKEEDA